jgi:2-haloacid dehalogenase
VAFAALETVSEELGHPLSQQKAEMIMDSYNELTAQSDALEALTTLRSAGIPVSILTNGSEKSTLRLVAKNGLELYIHSVISVEQVRKWKPFPEVYAHAAQKLNLDPSEICLVSHHTWDIHGAASSGMATAWVSRGLTYKRGFRLPLITGHSLADVADAVSRLANVPTS